MRVGRMVAAGIIGAVLVYLIVLAGGIASHTHADLCALLGAALTGSLGAGPWVAGAAAQLAVAIAAAVVYAAIFEWVTQRAGIVLGLIVALGHVIVAGIAVGFLPARRLIDAGVNPPAAFMEYRGALVVAAFVFAHLLFGAVTGALYGAVRHPVLAATTVWRDVTR